jgi:uncharacterized protein YtpQ (UPF0354 family)
MGRQVKTPQAFTEEIARAIAAALPSATITITGELRLKVREPSGFENFCGLGNRYQEYLLEPGRLGEIVREVTTGLLGPDDVAAKIDRTRIIPLIKDRSWLAGVRSELKAQGLAQKILSERFNDELIIVYAEDHPTKFCYLPINADIGVSRRDLRALAVRNLRRILPDVMMQGTTSVLMLTAGGYFEPSLLLLDDIWSSGQFKFDGDIVVAIPARDMLLVTGSRDRAGLEKVRELATRFAAEGAYPLTDTLFVYRDGRFRRFVE